ncbi:MAG: ATP-binding cassette domain-containing protein, partial [Lachnospiraceae bacterium]|nr:ATP-binding cassette domain-containing protein [Lachnospiraceae bacterium]
MEQTYAIELQNITKRFGSVVANDKVSLTLKKGEILCVLGENGSGKTTLVNMISGIYYPEEGRITVDGREVKIRSPKDSFDLGIGMVHQHFKLVDILTAAENIILGLPGGSASQMRGDSEDDDTTCLRREASSSFGRVGYRSGARGRSSGKRG